MAAAPNFKAVEAEELAAAPEVGIGMLGYGFMGKAHTNAYRKIPYIFWPPVARIRLVAMCGRNESAVAEAARRYGYEGYYTDWRGLVADDRIQILDNVGSHDIHLEPSIAAAENGKHVICEKPLALTATDAKRMLTAVAKAGVTHMTGFNYRFAPAVLLARTMIDQGRLGRLHTIRIRYNAGNQAGPPKPVPADRVGVKFGAHIGLGSHVIDMARFLVGEMASISAVATTFDRIRPVAGQPGQFVEVTDPNSFVASAEFENGAIGTIEASYVCAGRKNNFTWEVNGSEGSLIWDVEDLNRLQVFLDGKDKVDGLSGFEDVMVTESSHPYYKYWWPAGIGIGWEHQHINLIDHFVKAVVTNQSVEPYGPTFEDGYKAAVIAEAIEESHMTGRRVMIDYDL